MKENKNTQEVNSASQVDEATQNLDLQTKIDVDKLTEDEARSMLNEVLEANEEIINELSTAKADSEKFKDNWYRTTAELENFKRRNQDLRKNAYAEGKIDAIKNILIIGDSLDRALSMEMDEKTKQGVELIQKQFIETMKALGVEEINPVGEVFSPDNAEAIAMVDALDGEVSGTIRTVFKKGYKMDGKTVRYAQVIVVN